jgi:hypothetical protein
MTDDTGILQHAIFSLPNNRAPDCDIPYRTRQLLGLERCPECRESNDLAGYAHQQQWSSAYAIEHKDRRNMGAQHHDAQTDVSYPDDVVGEERDGVAAEGEFGEGLRHCRSAQDANTCCCQSEDQAVERFAKSARKAGANAISKPASESIIKRFAPVLFTASTISCIIVHRSVQRPEIDHFETSFREGLLKVKPKFGGMCGIFVWGALERPLQCPVHPLVCLRQGTALPSGIRQFPRNRR